MICSREFCPLEARAKAFDSYIREGQAKHGFSFKAHMEFGEACGLCKRTLVWTREADGETRIKSKEAA